MELNKPNLNNPIMREVVCPKCDSETEVSLAHVILCPNCKTLFSRKTGKVLCLNVSKLGRKQ